MKVTKGIVFIILLITASFSYAQESDTDSKIEKEAYYNKPSSKLFHAIMVLVRNLEAVFSPFLILEQIPYVEYEHCRDCYEIKPVENVDSDAFKLGEDQF